MITKFSRLINNPRSVQYIIVVYLLVSIMFSLLYYIILPLVSGIPSLEYCRPSGGVIFVNNFFDALYFSITSQTTVGYGDIVPSSLGGKIATMVQVIFGYFYLGFTMAFFTAQAILKSERFESFMLNYSKTGYIRNADKGVH